MKLYGLTFDQWAVVLGEYPAADDSVKAALRSRLQWRRQRLADPQERSVLVGVGEYRRDVDAANRLFDSVQVWGFA